MIRAPASDGPSLRPHPRLDFRSRQLPLSGIDGPVRADRRTHGGLHPAAPGMRRRRGAARAEEPFPYAWDDARRADEGAWRRSTRLPRRCSCHPAGSSEERGRMARIHPGGRRMNEALQAVIDRAWDDRDAISPDTRGEVRQAVDAAIASLDSGEARIAEPIGDGWAVHQWLKKAVLL